MIEHLNHSQNLRLNRFTGIETEETKEARTNVPKGMIRGMLLVIVISLITFIVGAAMPQDALLPLTSVEFPLLHGYNLMFDTESHLVTLMMVPGLYASAFGFVFAYGRQIFALSRSGLLPKFLSVTNSSGTPAVAMLVGSAFGFIFCIIQSFVPDVAFYETFVYNCMLIVAIINYIFQLICFILLRLNYPMLSLTLREREREKIEPITVVKQSDS